MHEELVSNIDALNTIDTKNFYIITPHQTISTWKKKNFIKHNNLKKIKYCKKNFSYTSDNNQSFLSVKTLRKIISELKI